MEIPTWEAVEEYWEHWRNVKMNPYKWLWSRIGGRKWTWIMRDFAYQNPFLLIMIAFALGIALHSLVEWNDVWKFFAGLLLAHLFWGTKWRKGQGKGGKR